MPVVHVEYEPFPYRRILFTVLWSRFLKEHNAILQHARQQ